MGAFTPNAGLFPRPPEQTDYISQYAHLAQLRQMLNMAPLQRQQAQQQIQAGQLDIQNKQQAYTDQQAATKAMQEWDGQDFMELPGLVLKHGGSAQAVFGLKNQILKQQTEMTKLSTDQLNNQKTINDYIAGHIANVASLPQEKQAQGFQDAVQDLVSKKYITPQQAQGLQYQGPQQLDYLKKTYQGLSGIQEDALKNAQTAEATGKGAEAQANAAKANAEAQGLTGQFAEARYRNILSNLSAGKPVSDDDKQFAKGYELANRKTTTQSDSLGVTSTNTSAPSGLSALASRMGVQTTPQGGSAPAGGGAPQPGGAQSTRDSLVDMIGQYKMNPQMFSRAIVKHPDLLAAVGQKYPDFDQTTYNAKNKIVQDYTSGGESKSINAISTALGHAGELGEAINALGNDNGLNMLRSMGNRLGVSVFGDDKVMVFNTIVRKLAPEITQAYVQGGGGEKERAANEEDFSASLGDKQLRGNLGETVKLLRSKIAAQEQQWNNTYRPSRPQDDFSTRFLTPGAKQTLQTWGSGGSGGQGGPTQGFTRIQASDGSMHDIPTANLDKAKQRDPNLKVVQ